MGIFGNGNFGVRALKAGGLVAACQCQKFAIVSFSAPSVFFLSLIGWLLSTQLAIAAPRFNLIANVLDRNFSTGADPQKNGFGLGFGYEMRLVGKVGLDFSLIYTKRNLTQIGQSLGNYLDVPVLLRWHLGKVLSLGAGGFYSLPLSGFGNTIYGVAGDLKLAIAIGRSMAFFIQPQARYDFSNAGTQQMNLFCGLVGLQFGL